MRLLQHYEPYPDAYSLFNLYPLFDLHIGARACDEKLLKTDIQRIAEDDNARFILGGDMIDCIARRGDKRYQEETLASWLYGKNDVIGQQRDYVCDMLAPIANKCWGIVKGNHEQAAEHYADRAVYGEIVQHIAAKAGKENYELALGVHGFIAVSFRRQAQNSSGGGWRLSLYVHHGYGGGNLPGSHALALGRVLGRYEADMVLMGHRHVAQHIVQSYVKVRGNNIEECNRIGLFVPSYLNWRIIPSNPHAKRFTDTYAEEKGMSPQPLGTTPIVIEPHYKNFHLIVSANQNSHVRVMSNEP